MSIDPGSDDPRRNDLLARIKEGMKVVDAGGDDVGTVSFVKMADLNDPDDVGDADRDVAGGLIDLDGDDGGILDILGDNHGVTERMERSGYIRIDASGIFSGDTFVEPRHIAGVEGDTVRLAVDKDALGKPA
jgi:hypothetical protein